jgi:hypothetical protein
MFASAYVVVLVERIVLTVVFGMEDHRGILVHECDFQGVGTNEPIVVESPLLVDAKMLRF